MDSKGTTRTYRVVKGQQYDRDGCHVHAEISSTLDLYSLYAADGTWDGGELVRKDHREVVEAAVLRVIATGQTEVVEVEMPTAPQIVVPQHRDTCPRCGTLCYGDCRS